MICNAIEERSCPVCQSRNYAKFASENIDREKITKYTYASRKKPEFMRLRMVRCRECDLVYVPIPPSQEDLASAYANAAYDSSEEANCAAETYGRVLRSHITRMQSKNCAVDVGAGNGAFLPILSEFGFKHAIGVEPSKSAIESASPEIRAKIREGIFSPHILSDVKPDLICSFMTLEHMPDPLSFIRSAHCMLSPGGFIAVIIHNWQGWLNRLLGLHSPIMDVEHMQLFCPKAIATLLSNAGFASPSVISFSNSYPLDYWLRLTPLPQRIKGFASDIFRILALSKNKLRFRVGNMLAIAQKQ